MNNLYITYNTNEYMQIYIGMGRYILFFEKKVFLYFLVLFSLLEVRIIICLTVSPSNSQSPRLVNDNLFVIDTYDNLLLIQLVLIIIKLNCYSDNTV